jgi:hypothetical protein
MKPRQNNKEILYMKNTNEQEFNKKIHVRH